MRRDNPDTKTLIVLAAAGLGAYFLFGRKASAESDAGGYGGGGSASGGYGGGGSASGGYGGGGSASGGYGGGGSPSGGGAGTGTGTGGGASTRTVTVKPLIPPPPPNKVDRADKRAEDWQKLINAGTDAIRAGLPQIQGTEFPSSFAHSTSPDMMALIAPLRPDGVIGPKSLTAAQWLGGALSVTRPRLETPINELPPGFFQDQGIQAVLAKAWVNYTNKG